MTKRAVVDDMVATGDFKRAEAERAFDQVFTSVDNVLTRGVGERVAVPGFGVFKREMSTRTSARNPQTGEAIALTPRPVTKFKESTGRK